MPSLPTVQPVVVCNLFGGLLPAEGTPPQDTADREQNAKCRAALLAESCHACRRPASAAGQSERINLCCIGSFRGPDMQWAALGEAEGGAVLVQGYFYYIFGFCFVVGMLTVLITVEVAIVCTYVQLCAEDYLWWYTSAPCVAHWPACATTTAS